MKKPFRFLVRLGLSKKNTNFGFHSYSFRCQTTNYRKKPNYFALLCISMYSYLYNANAFLFFLNSGPLQVEAYFLYSFK